MPLVWLLFECVVEERCTDPASSGLPRLRAILHILRLRVARLASHAIRKGLQWPLEETLGTQEAIFQLRLLLDTEPLALPRPGHRSRRRARVL